MVVSEKGGLRTHPTGLFALFILLLLSPRYAFADDIRVEARLDSREYLIGDWILLNIEVEHSADIVVLPPESGEKLGELDFIGRTDIPAEESDGRIIESWRLIVASYDAGGFTIPSVAIYYHLAGDSSMAAVYTDSLSVMVFSAGGDTLSEMHDIKPPVDVSRQFEDYLPYIVIVIILIILGLAYWWWRRRPGPVTTMGEMPAAVRVDPYDLAMRRLTELEAKRLWEKGFVKEYFSETTEIVREYFEGEFTLPALEMTTYELLEEIANMKIVALETAINFFNEADLVKFAKYIPEPEECRSSFKTAYSLIREAQANAPKPAAAETVTDLIDAEREEGL